MESSRSTEDNATPAAEPVTDALADQVAEEFTGVPSAPTDSTAESAEPVVLEEEKVKDEIEIQIDLLKDAGVDMTTDEPLELTMKEMNRVMDEMERLLAR